MSQTKKGLNTLCTHEGALEDTLFKGATSPLYMSSSYAFEDVDLKRYPRYFNTPNQEALGKKLAALEHAETAMIFGSGMAAISTALMAFLKAGDHVVFQQTLYGGTYNFAVTQLEKYGITYTFTEGWDVVDFEEVIQSNTKVIYLETPSNPLLTITDMKGVANLAKEKGIFTLIDNTFASPINQNPIDFGIDVVMHSATKYMGGHSDICAGVVASSKENMDRIYQTAICFGGSLSDYTVWLLERSIKTMALRVKAQNENALLMAKYLVSNPDVAAVNYPGLETHPEHELAKSQMKGFGGMLSFELKSEIDVSHFFRNLRLIKPSMSLAGLESTMISPAKTSHALMSPEDREKQGIKDSLVRFSLGIEELEDLIGDIEQAISETKSVSLPV
ncbi:trans-sulfuration enzyme family protein [Flagellimonas allohymeniacidonis]|uniref:Aminotransferase class I/II-fold pyridoxal phosphate-dependent enzyme n=1 Tax=Flagellimonas allohymeniacidonis TaxID=2517819 RepID=A0A4Q8QFJ0_9FLAO|nr:aminotransferase class I/II-fold pyridoxal phosphate-dependent enzyme [Allomuricauda hymeniacidonis]TAI48634.1 aminotransferase class I/II-fold pyridoxal phosphate-dependent enzyme [Allomuricauda hymeniacidonis]